MTRKPTTTTPSLRVVTDAPRANHASVVWNALQPLLRATNDLAPDDPVLLITVLCSSVSAESWRAGIDALVVTGELRRVFVGQQAHLALPAERLPRGFSPLSTSDDANAAANPPSSEAKDETFELEIAIDVERERLLLYRVFAVFGGIGLALLVREFLLLWADG